MPRDQKLVEDFSWRSHPLRRSPAKALLGCVLVAAIAAAVFVSFGPWWAAGSVVVLVLSLNRFFFPSRYVVNDRGISAHQFLRNRFMHWSDIRRFVYDRHGAYLSTRSRPSWLDAYTGLHIVFGQDREIAINRILMHMERASHNEDAPQTVTAAASEQPLVQIDRSQGDQP